MTGFQFILASLACYRLVVFITRDAGPFEIAKKIRNLKPHFLGCPFCVSVWVALIIEGLFLLSGVWDSPIVIVSIVLSMSSISIALDRTFTSDYKT